MFKITSGNRLNRQYIKILKNYKFFMQSIVRSYYFFYHKNIKLNLDTLSE